MVEWLAMDPVTSYELSTALEELDLKPVQLSFPGLDCGTLDWDTFRAQIVSDFMHLLHQSRAQAEKSTDEFLMQHYGRS